MFSWLCFHKWEEVDRAEFTRKREWQSGRTQSVEGTQIELRCKKCGDHTWRWSLQ